ncbi:hypothetical protein BDN70DRAFT_884073 [Pholiota conissans]|uniref:Uncharacterized protein n=1 Tax=Pholiota conissans TaxID=109636 RepID=A0A9P5YU18_9AGAR|nr:hypothetical protein BDN70DRAFT_884073 [Pholiota conissans]
MKRPRLSWHPKSKPSKVAVASSPSNHVQNVVEETTSRLPQLPLEIWRKIIPFVTRLAGATAIELDDPFSLPYENEEYPEVDPGIFNDRRNLRLVCRGWRDCVTVICAEYLTIYTGKELQFLVELFERSKADKTIEKHLGEWTTRVDFKILGSYDVSHVVRLLQCIPNLLIYTNKNGPANSPQRCTPPEVLNALITYCSRSLKRVEWNGAGEAPRFQDFVVFCNSLHHLITLKLVAIYSFPLQESEGVPHLVYFRGLKTLSLGTIPCPEESEYRPEFARTWDPFLQYMSLHTTQLPALERFECDIFPLLSLNFFKIHGHKMRQFRTVACNVETALPDALNLCPNLDVLVLSQGTDTIDFPPFHPSLKKICIVPTIDVTIGVPQRVMIHAIIRPLDQLLKDIETMTAPSMHELRIWNIGAYARLVDHAVWLGFWWRRWNIRGVHFCDKKGISYQKMDDPSEALLNSIRA